MDNLTFESSLSLDEIEENFKNIDFFSEIMEGLQEALAYQQGRASDAVIVHIVEA